MPNILSRDPAFLSRPAPGFNLFQPDGSVKGQHSSAGKSDGASSRKLAHRGTEVFVAVGSEVRWSELGLLRDAGEEAERGHKGTFEPAEGSSAQKAYRVLKTNISRPITHLTVSPSGTYLAILTSHTCHVAILPATSLLRPHETSPLRLKTFQIGPTAHVLEQAPLVSALWHPLSPSGDCLVTITHDACVRLWELDGDNRSSFNEPSLAVDLKKLANATSTQADLSTSKYGTNKGFSPDDVEMQVAAACFGGRGGEDEHGWASMTLWVAMTEGDVYALCPLLPSTWRAPATMLPTLSTSVIEKAKAIRRDAEATEAERRNVDQQSKWLAEVDSQDPRLLPGADEFDTIEVYSRPKQLSAVPKLQGPFQISPEPDFGEITDIHVIAPKIDDEALYDEDNENLDDDDGLSVSIICLATTTNEVHVCLDVNGVEAEWLPSKRSRAITFDDTDDWKELLLFESVDLAQTEDEDDGWPIFTASPTSRYEFFVTHSTGVCSISLQPWITMLEDELANPSDSGAGFRLNIVLDSAHTAVEQIVEAPAVEDTDHKDINAAIAIEEPGFGCLLLTSTNDTPYATILDLNPQTADPYAPDTPVLPAGLLPSPPPRAPYRPAPEFTQPSALPKLLKTAHEKRLLGHTPINGPIRFSPAALQLLTEAHRVMSAETHRLGMAAADLFRRCERMRAELVEQVRKVAEIAQQVDAVTGEDGGEEGEQEHSGREKIDERMERSDRKTVELNRRVETLRKKMALLGGAQLSAKERAFVEEVDRLQASVLPSAERATHTDDDGNDATQQSTKSGGTALASRFAAVQSLQHRLVQQVEETTEGKGDEDASAGAVASTTQGPVAVGGGYRKQKLAQVMALLETETALVEGVMERLKRLQGGA
ncbi:hypothetical protein BDY17DRAFT_292988 [Neohortaea acidophila]|uniref:Nuclear pore complex protein An-Nup82 n=1 Tax=Neohortaea acidophila TaxID=245834 RepID=A0A6A6PYQ8_9PEZI|nr:uncharacterized protein BDY17DRAFT_292988 [Neohortaea acidophila]KAF2485132.1 hypothetical protein BDY17DRAFT_292988 [Neohortaea acidophila]